MGDSLYPCAFKLSSNCANLTSRTLPHGSPLCSSFILQIDPPFTEHGLWLRETKAARVPTCGGAHSELQDQVLTDAAARRAEGLARLGLEGLGAVHTPQSQEIGGMRLRARGLWPCSARKALVGASARFMSHQGA